MIDRTIDRKKVIAALESCTTFPKCQDCPWEECEGTHNKWLIPVGLALAALYMLEEKEPKQVHILSHINNHKVGECPNCGRRISQENSPNFCGVCGQAVKWE